MPMLFDPSKFLPSRTKPLWLTVCKRLTKASEGCPLHAYPDPATGGKPYTVGYGATGKGITQYTVWTQEEADQDLEFRLKKLGKQVDKAVKVSINPYQKAALVDFAYNEGIEALRGSTLMRKLNRGDFTGAASEFRNWVYANGKQMAGLVTRRGREKKLFVLGDEACQDYGS